MFISNTENDFYELDNAMRAWVWEEKTLRVYEALAKCYKQIVKAQFLGISFIVKTLMFVVFLPLIPLLYLAVVVILNKTKGLFNKLSDCLPYLTISELNSLKTKLYNSADREHLNILRSAPTIIKPLALSLMSGLESKINLCDKIDTEIKHSYDLYGEALEAKAPIGMPDEAI
jgi:hypothetical protein